MARPQDRCLGESAMDVATCAACHEPIRSSDPLVYHVETRQFEHIRCKSADEDRTRETLCASGSRAEAPRNRPAEEWPGAPPALNRSSAPASHSRSAGRARTRRPTARCLELTPGLAVYQGWLRELSGTAH